MASRELSSVGSPESLTKASGDVFLKPWVLVTFIGAVVMTALDAALLQKSRGFFTGGFLSVDHVASAAEIAAFIAASLVIDAAVIGLIAATVMWALARIRVTTRAAAAGGLIAATAPLVLVDAASYQILRYFGTGFDLSLMFELTGRSVAEIFAVSSSYLLGPLLLVLFTATAAGALVWAVDRRGGPRYSPQPLRVLLAPAVMAAIGCAILGAAVSASDPLSNGLLRKPSGDALAFVINRLTDVDRDGFGAIGRLKDPDRWNARVFPYAVDIPGNGVDENGVAGDLPPAAEKYPENPVRDTAWLRKPDIVLIALESFRADLVGASFEGRPVTPVLNELATRGLSSSRAYSHNGYTVQSRFHLLSGSLIGRRNTRTLIDDFKVNGYAVGYFSGQDESFGAEEYRVGFDRADVAYDARSDKARRYSTFATPGSLAVPLQAVQERVGAFVEDRRGSPHPLFMYVNFEDTHFPYTHERIDTLLSSVRLSRHRIVPEQRDALWATYVNTVANIDRAIGQLLAGVRRARGSDPAVVITADHGESLFESGFLGHGYALNDVQTRVPFIVVGLPMRVPDPFAHIDLRAALNDALCVPPDQPSVPTQVQARRPVFQYLGDLRRPRQIGLLEGGSRAIYDFRTGDAQTGDAAPQPVARLRAPQLEQTVRLIRYWEWMNLAARGGQ